MFYNGLFEAAQVLEYQDKCQGDKSPTHLVKLAAALAVNKLEHMVTIMICMTTEIRGSSHKPQPRYAMYCTYSAMVPTLNSLQSTRRARDEMD